MNRLAMFLIRADLQGPDFRLSTFRIHELTSSELHLRRLSFSLRQQEGVFSLSAWLAWQRVAVAAVARRQEPLQGLSHKMTVTLNVN